MDETWNFHDLRTTQFLFLKNSVLVFSRKLSFEHTKNSLLQKCQWCGCQEKCLKKKPEKGHLYGHIIEYFIDLLWIYHRTVCWVEIPESYFPLNRWLPTKEIVGPNEILFHMCARDIHALFISRRKARTYISGRHYGLYNTVWILTKNCWKWNQSMV